MVSIPNTDHSDVKRVIHKESIVDRFIDENSWIDEIKNVFVFTVSQSGKIGKILSTISILSGLILFLFKDNISNDKIEILFFFTYFPCILIVLWAFINTIIWKTLLRPFLNTLLSILQTISYKLNIRSIVIVIQNVRDWINNIINRRTYYNKYWLAEGESSSTLVVPISLYRFTYLSTMIMIDENIDEYWRAGVQFRFKNNSFYEIHLFKNSKSSELKMRLHMNSLDKNFELGDSMPDIHFDSSIKFEIQLVGENIEIKLNNEILNRERIGQEFEFSEVSFNAWADGKKYKIKFNDIVVKA